MCVKEKVFDNNVNFLSRNILIVPCLLHHESVLADSLFQASCPFFIEIV